MAVKVAYTDGKGRDVLVVSQLTGDNIWRGKDRKGVRCADWVRETTTDRNVANPQVEKASILIETVAVLGVDKLTKQDIAAHEYLLACAREAGIEKPAHGLPMKQMCEYLGVASSERVWQSLVRLQQTLIQYNIIDPKTRHRVLASMVRVATSTDRESGRTSIRYAIPGVVRRAILRSRGHTWLDINVFPKFTSKYAARLYPRLALMAGYDVYYRSWTPNIQELAVYLGYAGPSEAVHVGSFFRVIDKALAEIEEHAPRFRVSCVKPKRGKGRGRPVEGRFLFTASETLRDLFACQEAYLPPTHIARIEDRRYSPLAEHEHPSVRLFAQAQTLTGIDAGELSDRWRFNVADARLHPERRFGGLVGRVLVETLERQGVREAFKQWVTLAVQLEELQQAAPELSATRQPEVRGIATESWVDEDVWVHEAHAGQFEVVEGCDEENGMFGVLDANAYGLPDEEPVFVGEDVDDDEIDF